MRNPLLLGEHWSAPIFADLIRLHPDAVIEGVTADNMIREVLDAVETPKK